jgi:predicted MPP superfamily phosphohydrolase
MVKYLIISLIAGLLLYGRFVEPDMVQIRTIDIETDFINKALKGRKIVHLSDLHLSKFGKAERKILNTIDQINPDLIFLTGDYIKWKGDIKPALNFLSRLKAKHGVFAVMGDYDYSNSRTSCLFCHGKGKIAPTKEHNIIMLRNSSHDININDDIIKIAGMDEGYDDPGFFKENNKFDNNSLLLVLSHSPLTFDQFSDKDKIFMFAGDTHGGQVKSPLWLFRFLGYKKNVKYNYGLFHKGHKTMYVTRGTGTSHFKFRLFCPPEIAVFEF